jgi:hypothetical protein
MDGSDWAAGEHGSERAQKAVQHANPDAGSGIHINPSQKGSLHEALGVPQGNKIPVSKIKRAEHSSSDSLRKKAQFADNARGFKHG